MSDPEYADKKGENRRDLEREYKKRFLFPFETIRESQREMLLEVEKVLKDGKHLVVHAPTGLGKTIATIGPALRYAKENGKKLFFVTSRHTQHIIAVETLRKISEIFGMNITASDIIGKKWMCLQKNVQTLFSGEFSEYCRKLIEERKCEYYERMKKGSGFSVEARKVIRKLLQRGINSTKDIILESSKRRMCPYYVSVELGKSSLVIISDYYYIFNPAIRESFFNKIGAELENSIIIVDEGHNLGERIRELASSRVTGSLLKRAVSEAKKNSYENLVPVIARIKDFLVEKAKAAIEKESQQTYVKKEELVEALKTEGDFDGIVSDFETAGGIIRETQKQSYIGSIGTFLESWRGEDEGFARILSLREGKNDASIVLERVCLDPSVIARDVLESAHSVILMSGTLQPTEMYRDLLGFPKRTVERSYSSPFSEENRRIIVVPGATTKYSARNSEQFRKIAYVCAEIINSVPGNSAVFFPSYFLMDSVHKHFSKLSIKTIFIERSGMTKDDRENFLEKFKKYKDSGAVLLGVIAGSFGEGIDLPGDYLKAVVIVGLPLQKPDLRTKSLIDYFDRKFGKGWDYGYVYPAFNRAIQSAGRCIRTEQDRGVIAFVDTRYTWQRYSRIFPSDWKIQISDKPGEVVREFFRR